MKHVGLFKSGDTNEALIEHMLLADIQKQVIFPKGASGTTLWISGYFTNLSPTFDLHLTFYNSKREAQEIIVDSFETITIRNQNIERLLIRTTSDEDNTTGFGVWEYVFEGVVAETEQEALDLLRTVSIERSFIIPDDRFVDKLRATARVSDNGTTPGLVIIPNNRQIFIFDISVALVPDTLDNVFMDNSALGLEVEVEPDVGSTTTIFEATITRQEFQVNVQNVDLSTNIVGDTVGFPLIRIVASQNNLSNTTFLFVQINYVII